MKCEKCPADSSLGCTVGVKPYQLRNGDAGCAWNMRTIEKRMNDHKFTVYDQIHAMDVDEFAFWLSDIAGWLSEYEGKVHPILEWLKQEVDH